MIQARHGCLTVRFRDLDVEVEYERDGEAWLDAQDEADDAEGSKL